jgi:hypothetical protein
MGKELLVKLKQQESGLTAKLYFNKQIQFVFRNEVMGIP